ncbi:MAG: prepilin-type N-terminal cleavage/methylation domain-containing protein [Planctomycetaceae bacterium]|nr:prepilin-type N-terminal cleavage/methylation domain-containing protein [Planctomycetaceae bacterium]
MPARKPSPAAAVRPGFSLTELLIASAVALLVMAGVATMIGTFGRAASQSQSLVALAGRMRSTAWQLRQDLSGVTAELVPWARPESNSGYFELLEGPQADTGTPSGLVGDTDDILLFTTRAVGGPFVGRYGSNSIESDSAEVAWFCRQAADQPLPGTTLFNLHRRQLLVVGYVGQTPFFAGGTATPVPVASLLGSNSTPLYDLSLRREGASAVPNTLADLTKRENRLFLRSGTGQLRSGTFPYAVLTDSFGRLTLEATFDETDRAWEDVVLTNVISFDVRVFDPQSLPNADYVQLSGSTAATSILLRAADARSGLTRTYDTWSLHYEFNGIDDDNDGVIDDGTNGLDDNNNVVPDDPAEYETSPPYPVPLRGIEVRIRCYEPSSNQVRQMTVRHSFIPK